MLTAKENMRQSIIKGGKPDRFVNQYEAVNLMMHPQLMHNGGAPSKGIVNSLNAWGVTMSWPDNVPGAFPVHTEDKIVVKDIEHWQDYVKGPDITYTQEEWAQWGEMYKNARNDKAFTCSFIAPGMFEQVHYLCSMTAALEYYLTYPDEIMDMIKYIKDWELGLAEKICSNLHPEMILHHDDWGSGTNSFLRPSMFEDFFLEPYKEVYKYYHDHGVEFILHHSDSYGANIVPTMIEMGIDVWQGAMEINNVPELVKKYEGQIAFMGNIDNKSCDFTEWTDENNEKVVRRALEGMTPNGYLPCIVQGGPGSVFPGVYLSLCKYIDQVNEERFGISVADQEALRMPHNVMF